MQIERRYRKLDWWSLIEHIDNAVGEDSSTIETYVEILDELRMRILESVSEGSSFKIKKQANRLCDSFKNKFARPEDLAEISQIEEFFN